MKQHDGYSARYDAFYDLETGQWAEAGCKDQECEYCKDRPDTAHGLANDINLLKIIDTSKQA